MTTCELDALTRADRDIITAIIPHGAHVLDLGCGDGGLLAELIATKEVIGRGLDIDEKSLISCIHQGLSVYMGDLDKGLADYPDRSYDYVILNQTLQVMQHPEQVIGEMLRVGRYGIVGFPNFGYWQVRFGLLFGGRMPKSRTLPFEWYDTPNIHLLTTADFKAFCRAHNIRIIREEYLMFGKWRHSALINPLANLFGLTGMFVIEGTGHKP